MILNTTTTTLNKPLPHLQLGLGECSNQIVFYTHERFYTKQPYIRSPNKTNNITKNVRSEVYLQPINSVSFIRLRESISM